MTACWSFSRITGQERACGEIALSLERERLNHAYLLEGMAGVGRCSMARALAARFLCLAPQGLEACGECKSCKLLAGGNHPDYLELPRDCRELRIRRFVEREGGTEQIDHQPVLEFMRLKPMLAHGRVCVIPEAERMNAESANAFLKTLEEPPQGSLILLTCAARERVLGTIVSRCRRVGLSPVSEELVREELIRRGAGAQNAAVAARLCEGSVAQALALLESASTEDWDWLCRSLESLTPAGAVRFGEEVCARLRQAKSGEEKRQEAGRLFDLFALHIRRGLREGLSPRAGARALQVLWEAGERLAANVRPELVVYNAALESFSALKRA